MNQEKLLEIERKFRALIDSLTAEELEAELRRIEETVSEPVVVDVLPDGEAQDDEDEDTENL